MTRYGKSTRILYSSKSTLTFKVCFTHLEEDIYLFKKRCTTCSNGGGYMVILLNSRELVSKTKINSRTLSPVIQMIITYTDTVTFLLFSLIRIYQNEYKCVFVAAAKSTHLSHAPPPPPTPTTTHTHTHTHTQCNVARQRSDCWYLSLYSELATIIKVSLMHHIVINNLLQVQLFCIIPYALHKQSTQSVCPTITSSLSLSEFPNYRCFSFQATTAAVLKL